MLRAVGVLLDGGVEFLHRRRGFLECRRLLLGPLAQLVVALGNLRRGARHRLRTPAHLAHHRGQAGLHVLQCRQQLCGFVLAPRVELAAQVARCDGARDLHRPLDRARDRPAEQHAGAEARSAHREHQHDGDRRCALAIGGGLCGDDRAVRRDLVDRCVQQLGRLTVHAADGSVACRGVEAGRYEGVEALAVVHAHRGVRRGEPLHQRLRFAWG